MEKRAEWNWSPISALQRPNGKHGIESDKNAGNDTPTAMHYWQEVPLMADDDILPSPRGKLVFKGNSESENDVNANLALSYSQQFNLSDTVVEIGEAAYNSDGEDKPVTNTWSWKIVEDAAKALTAKGTVANGEKITSENLKLKKLIAYYKRKQEQMSANYDKLRETYASEQLLMKQQIKDAETDLQNSFRQLLDDENKIHSEKLEHLRRVIGQKEAKIKHLADKQLKKDVPCDIKMDLVEKDQQLKDAKDALDIAHARADQIRTRLVTSTNMQKLQTTEIRKLTKSLDGSIKQTARLKKDLLKEQTSKKQIEDQLDLASNKIDQLQNANIKLNVKHTDLTRERMSINAELNKICCGQNYEMTTTELLGQVSDVIIKSEVEFVLERILSKVDVEATTMNYNSNCSELEARNVSLENSSAICVKELVYEKNSNANLRNQLLLLQQDLEKMRFENDAVVQQMIKKSIKANNELVRLRKDYECINDSLKMKLQKSTTEKEKLLKDNHVIRQRLNVFENREMCEIGTQCAVKLCETSTECDLGGTSRDEIQSALHRTEDEVCYLRDVIEYNEDRLTQHVDRINQLNETCHQLHSQCYYQQNRLRDLTTENLKLQNLITSLTHSNNTEVASSVHSESERTDIPESASVMNMKTISNTSINSLDNISSTDLHSGDQNSHTNEAPIISSVTTNKVASNQCTYSPPTSPHPPISVVQWTPAPSVASSSTSAKGRRRKGKIRNKNLKNSLPEWRQENPNNHVHCIRFGSTETGQRRIGPPLSEAVFNTLVTSQNLNEQSRDDGYHSASTDCISEGNIQPWNITQRFLNNNEDAHSEICEEDDYQNNLSPTQDACHEEVELLLKYEGIEFDATKCTFAQIRQLALDSGILSSAEGMNKLLDFMANKSKELNNDPKWAGKHSLGNASDWLLLKQHYGV